MLSECKKKEYFDCVNSKGKSLAAESPFLILILEQLEIIFLKRGVIREFLWPI
jgi:hypothetical protein